MNNTVPIDFQNDKPFVIGIAGESGVGKTTIAEIISLFYGPDTCVLLSTDDLHKYNRSHPFWTKITHLHPDANNLELGDFHLEQLLKWHPIWRSVYNHQTGNFNPPVKINPKPVIIIEGLHAFYTEKSKQMIDFKIFVDTDENLRTHWKILRDTEQRGYRYSDVLEAIERRRQDSWLLTNQQLKDCDAKIQITIPPFTKPYKDPGHEGKEYNLHCFITKKVLNESVIKTGSALLDFIESYMKAFDDFIMLCEKVGNDIELSQGAGGNISVSVGQLMIIKASGVPLKKVTRIGGYSIVKLAEIPKYISNDEELNSHIENAVIYKDRYLRPSMETGFHAVLDFPIVLHAHPVYLTLILCMQNAKEIIESGINDFEKKHCFIPYLHPGWHLFSAVSDINPQKTVLFLGNHGIILAGSSKKQLLQEIKSLNNWAKKYIQEQLGSSFLSFDFSFANHTACADYFFPDAVIFSNHQEIKAMNNYIYTIGSKVGKLNRLSEQHIVSLKTMEAEKYRQQQA